MHGHGVPVVELVRLFLLVPLRVLPVEQTPVGDGRHPLALLALQLQGDEPVPGVQGGLDRPEGAVQQAGVVVVAQADQLVALERVSSVGPTQLADASVVGPAGVVLPDEDLVGLEYPATLEVGHAHHLALPIPAQVQSPALTNDARHLNDGVVAGLSMDVGQEEVGLLLGEEPGPHDRRQLGRVAQGEDRHPEGQQVFSHLLVHHGGLVHNQELRLLQQGVSVQVPGRAAEVLLLDVDQVLQVADVLGDDRVVGLLPNELRLQLLELGPTLLLRGVDQLVDGAGVRAALRLQDVGGLPGRGGEENGAVDALGDVPSQRGLARSGIAEQAEDG